jgi:hypothetical protein
MTLTCKVAECVKTATGIGFKTSYGLNIDNSEFILVYNIKINENNLLASSKLPEFGYFLCGNVFSCPWDDNKTFNKELVLLEIKNWYLNNLINKTQYDNWIYKINNYDNTYHKLDDLASEINYSGKIKWFNNDINNKTKTILKNEYKLNDIISNNKESEIVFYIPFKNSTIPLKIKLTDE